MDTLNEDSSALCEQVVTLVWLDKRTVYDTIFVVTIELISGTIYTVESNKSKFYISISWLSDK